ncbi:DUF1365 domain-containing protein [Undibacterium sp. Ji83W]|uniref:DUF1365 domain-containing protein n=1 Tax=Undibacterium sp. Ji83W TaxID=3413043 RepID=UPI003BF1F799
MNTPATKSAVVLCTGEVMHKRLRPAKNAFRYGVFFIRVPVRDINDIKRMSTPALFSVNRFNVLSFHERDHGDAGQPLAQWLDDLLQSEGITDADGEIWLQCFPRVFGYVFNPVSFWFCHRQDGSLRAVVCEVRNTFGEKHLYLLEKGGKLANGEELQARKIFHVSPFCKVEGSYRFRFMQAQQEMLGQDAGHVQKKHLARIDYADAEGPLLLTSVSGREQTMSNTRITQVMLRYPFMTIGVVLRIHIQALRLWIKRVPFISKPIPPTEELSR